MLSQLLFGEVCEIIEKKNKHWFKVRTAACLVTGWVQSNQIKLIGESEFHKMTVRTALTLEVCHSAFNEDSNRFIVLGSSLPLWDGMSCQISGASFIYNGQATPTGGLEFKSEMLIKVVRRYLYCPELTGGRTPFGLDAGAFIQQVMRIFGKPFPRLVHEQAMLGELVHFSELSREGDLAFCCDEEGKIIHAGIMISSDLVAHVHGEVRIDPLDHFGIFSTSRKKYTHMLRIIRRVF